jgi:ABC-type transporter Mla MlaB component
MRELAGLLALGKYPAVQKLLLSALDPQSERSGVKHAQALILLDTYRLLGDMDGFDDTVLAYVHWWNGLTPSWDLPAASDEASPWALHGTVHGASGLALPELGWSNEAQKIHVDCSALRHMDLPATKALLQWLERAKTRNYEVSLNAPSPLVCLVWSTLDLEKFAHVRTNF